MAKKSDAAGANAAPDSPAAEKSAPEKAKGKPRKDAAAAGGAEGAAPAAGAPKKAPKPAAGGESKRDQRGRSMRGPSKRFKKASELMTETPLALNDAIARIKKMGAGVKFDQTVNIVMLLGIDPKQADQALRGAVSLPKGIGKSRKVICFTEGEDIDKAKAAGAIEAGGDDLIKKVNDGWQDFDVAIAHPRLMGKVGKLGRVLGPTGKMPSPKNGTVTAEIETAIREFAAGKVEYRNDTGGNVHGIVGKLSFSEADLHANIEAFIDHIRKLKPPTSKGVYIRKVCISATMTPGLQLQVGA